VTSIEVREQIVNHSSRLEVLIRVNWLTTEKAGWWPPEIQQKQERPREGHGSE
jgi:hypothetical protein